MFPKYDIIVVGAGHAGCEAAAAAANLGCRVLLITMNLQNTAQMSCNPAMGGIAKGQIVREIDALGGYSGIVSDESMLQFRMLNRSKGPAMWSPRSQNDRMMFSAKWREKLEKIDIDFYQDSVIGLSKSQDRITGVYTALGHNILSECVVLTNGTFLNGIIHIGNRQLKGGRIAEKTVSGITEQLVEWGFESNRLKTGTPPRLDGRTINYSKMTEQVGDIDVTGFSFLETALLQKQLSCWITYTNQKVHEVLETGFHDSPMFQGRIQGTGPRYCPSIEDKITRFASKDRHQLFVEPEGWNTVEVYLNGFSSSLPEEIQFAALRKIDGLENCKMFRPGYAIEYDYFPPTQLNNTLETKLLKNLFFAGQINGTTGYEEAACQGLIAGINAAQAVRNKKPLVLGRNQAYIGVLIDDLINKGTEEPYRMFTSRAEFRTLLRQDNADLRLTELSYDLGLASSERFENVKRKKKAISELSQILKQFKLTPEQLNPFLRDSGSAPITQKINLEKLLLRPEIDLENLISYFPLLKSATTSFSDTAIKQVEISIKYDVYLKKEEEMVEKMISLENQLIPETFNYEKISSLSAEARQKFIKIRPATLGQASRISGVNPTDIQILTVFMGR